MRVKFAVLCGVLLTYGCASGQYVTESGKERNAWVDLIVVAAAIPSSTDSPRERARKSGIVSGYLSEDSVSDTPNTPSTPINNSGNCYCPYDIAKDGTRCGARSAWSKPSGSIPSCSYLRLTPQDFEEKK